MWKRKIEPTGELESNAAIKRTAFYLSDEQ
jgi:hypothetical protein